MLNSKRTEPGTVLCISHILPLIYVSYRIVSYTYYFVRLTIIFAHKSLCQNVNVCYFNFNNAHTAEILAVRLWFCCYCWCRRVAICCHTVQFSSHWFIAWRSLTVIIPRQCVVQCNATQNS